MKRIVRLDTSQTTSSRKSLLHYIVLSEKSRESNVTLELGGKRKGNHRPVIHYHVDDYTVGGFEAAVQLTNQLFSQMKIEDKSAYNPSDAGYVKGYSYHGSGHVVGTHRMGFNEYDSVVDSYQRTWQYHNLYLAGCGSMPTIATSNPTLTCAALSIRTARQIIKEHFA